MQKEGGGWARQGLLEASSCVLAPEPGHRGSSEEAAVAQGRPGG